MDDPLIPSLLLIKMTVPITNEKKHNLKRSLHFTFESFVRFSMSVPTALGITLNFLQAVKIINRTTESERLWKWTFRSRFLRLIPLLLIDDKMESDETLGMYTVYPQLLHRQLFDFRFRPQTGSGLFFTNRKLKTLQPEVKKYLIEKLTGFCNKSPIFVFWFLNPVSR